MGLIIVASVSATTRDRVDAWSINQAQTGLGGMKEPPFVPGVFKDERARRSPQGPKSGEEGARGIPR